LANTFNNIRAAVLFFFVLSIALTPSLVRAAPLLPIEKIYFNRIGILDPEDRSRQSIAKAIGIQIRRELAGTFRFNVVPQSKLSKELPLSTPELIKLAKQFKLDGIITGRVALAGDQLKLELSLLDGNTAMPFAREYAIIKGFKNPDVVDKNIRNIMTKLIHRIPYQATVTGIRNKGRTIVIDAGQLNGLGVGMKVRIFDIGKVKKNPFTGELIGVDQVAIGELTVIRADERVSQAKPFRLKKGRRVGVGQYVAFEPSDKVLSRIAHRREEILAVQEREWAAMDVVAQKETARKPGAPRQERPTPVPKVSRGRLELGGGWGWSEYSLNADSYDFNQKVTSFPIIRAAGEYWVIPSVGIDADYQIGFFKLESQSGGSINARARPNWITANLKFRRIFRPGRTDLQLIGRMGYMWYNYRLSETNSQMLINTRYRGPSLGLEVRLPLAVNVATAAGVDYQPVVTVSEDPATSGQDSSAWSVQLHAEMLYRLRQRLWMSVRYQFQDYKVNFSGMGTRAGGITGAKTSDALNGVTVGLILEF
jgi:DNA-binding Lrp family transcriptional regulator